jgi:autotransporter translocation and assembly factor TamB
LPVYGSLKAAFADRNIRADLTDIHTLNLQLQGQILMRSLHDLSGTVAADTPDIGGFLNEVQRLSGHAPSAGVHGALHFTGNLAGAIDRPELAGEISAPALAAGDFSGVSLTATGNYKAETIAIQAASLRWQEQSVNAHGTIGLSGNSPSLDLAASSSGVSVNAILAGLGRPAPVNGNASMDAVIRGTVAEPHGTANADIRELRAYGEDLGRLTLHAEIQGRQLSISGLELDKPAPAGPPGRLTAQGSYNLDSRSFSFTAAGNGLAISNLALPAGRQLQGRIDVTAGGSGTLDRPVVNGDIHVSELKVGNTNLDTISVRAAGGADTIHFDVEVPAVHLKSQIVLRPVSPYPVIVDASIDHWNLEPFLQASAAEGMIQATLHGDGDLANWKAGFLDVRADPVEYSYHGKYLHNVGPL